MHFFKTLDLELKRARDAFDVDGYIRARKQRNSLGAFDRYRLRLTGELLRNLVVGSVLDIGANIGAMVKHYQQYNTKITLCDLDHFVLTAARKNYPELKFTCANLKSLPFKNNSFNTVVSLETIEHLTLSQQEEAINELIRVAKPGAILCVSTPNRFSLPGIEGSFIQWFVKGYKWDAWDNDHKYIYSARDFEIFLKRFQKKLLLKKFYGSYYLPGSLLVRLPVCLQRSLGMASYLVSRYLGNLFPFRYIGFTAIAVLKKKS